MRDDILRRAAAADAAAIAQRARMEAIHPRVAVENRSMIAVWIAAMLIMLFAYITQIDDGHNAPLQFFILAPLAIALYLLPSFVAYKRVRRNRSLILLLNLLFGWTFVGWVLALVWATTTPTAPTMAQSNRMGLGELAVRTAVRATVWETVFSVFRLFR